MVQLWQLSSNAANEESLCCRLFECVTTILTEMEKRDDELQLVCFCDDRDIAAHINPDVLKTYLFTCWRQLGQLDSSLPGK